MAFTYTNARGVEYVLHGKTAALKNGNSRIIYFFAKKPGKEALDSLPAGYQVAEGRNGLPILRRIR